MHEQRPEISTTQVNPVTDGEAVAGGRSLNPFVQAHGILMIIAWPVLAVTGIFFAAWMRPALPNGEWFQVSPPSTFLETVCLHLLMDSSSLPGSLPLSPLPLLLSHLSLLPSLTSLSHSYLSRPPFPPSLGPPCFSVSIIICDNSGIHPRLCWFSTE